MTSPATPRRLRTQLMVMLALLLATAGLCAMVSAIVVRRWLPWAEHFANAVGVGSAFLVFAIGAALTVERTILEPLRYLTDAARDIAAGNLERRMPAVLSRELQDLCAHVDRVAHGAFEDRAHVIRAENLASLGRLAGSL